jgi:hypothetical protein
MATESRGPRPDGVPGLLIDEIQITGIFRTRNGYVAQVRGALPKSYLLKEGDQVFDGDVVLIEAREVTFKQVVLDGPKPFREVVKALG